MLFNKSLIFCFDRKSEVCGVRDHSRVLNAELLKSGIQSELLLHPKIPLIKLIEKIRQIRPDVIFIQYTPIGYGGYIGLSAIPHALISAAKILNIPVITFIHEPYPNFKESKNIPDMAKFTLEKLHWIRFKSLLAMSDIVITSIEKWRDLAIDTLSKNSDTHVQWLSVCGNMPVYKNSGEIIQSTETGNVLLWGSLSHPGKRFSWNLEMFEKCPEMTIEYFGPESEYLREKIAKNKNLQKRIHVNSVLPEEEIVEKFRNSAFLSAPFLDGISTRRGTVLSAMGNALPILTTCGELTDSIWKTHSPVIMAKTKSDFIEGGKRLFNDKDFRLQKSEDSFEFYSKYLCWDVVINELKRLVNEL